MKKSMLILFVESGCYLLIVINSEEGAVKQKPLTLLDPPFIS